LESNRGTYLKQLIYRSWHRGCKETDILLGDFAKAQLAEFSDSDLQDYEAILETDDNDIYDWISGKTIIPQHINSELIKRIQTFYARGVGYEDA
jgi:antitoxin CptB